MTRFFITRPIFASVLSIIIVLSGLAAAFKLPIAQYPQIAPPTVIITASYPGASAETLSKTVAAVRPITVGGWFGDRWSVLSGLNAGDQVITDNLIKVRPGAPVAPHAPDAAPAAPQGQAPEKAKS